MPPWVLCAADSGLPVHIGVGDLWGYPCRANLHLSHMVPWSVCPHSAQSSFALIWGQENSFLGTQKGKTAMDPKWVSLIWASWPSYGFSHTENPYEVPKVWRTQKDKTVLGPVCCLVLIGWMWICLSPHSLMCGKHELDPDTECILVHQLGNIMHVFLFLTKPSEKVLEVFMFLSVLCPVSELVNKQH